MGVLIDFPKKQSFIDKYGSGLSPELRECLSLGYDEITEQLKNVPRLNVKLAMLQPGQIKTFNKEYRKFILKLVTQILVEKANVRLLQQELAQYGAGS